MMDADLRCSDTLGVSWSAVDTIILLDFAPLRCACPGALRRAPLLWAMAESISRARPACADAGYRQVHTTYRASCDIPRRYSGSVRN